MTDHRRFCVPDARAALLDYREATHPDVPHLQLYFVTPGTVVAAAAKMSKAKPASAPPCALIQNTNKTGKANAQSRDPL